MRIFSYLCVCVEEKEDGSPLFLLPEYCKNMDANIIKEALEPIITERGLEILKVKITKDNDITVTIASKTGSVSMDDCVEVNRKFTSIFDQDKEDYSVTITSPGPGRQKDDDDE